MSRYPELTPDTFVGRSVTRLSSAYLDDEVMLLNVDMGRYYNLNRVGTLIWQLLESPCTIAEMCQELLSNFDVTPEVCQRDIIEHVSLLVAEGLVSVVEAGAVDTDGHDNGLVS